MKKYNLYIGAGLLTLSGAFASCKSDYLDEGPITYISDEQLGESVQAARAALYGLCQAMYCGFYNDNNDRINQGEPWFQTYYGDAGSPDFWDSFLWGYQAEWQNWQLMLRNTAYASRNAWMYGYNLVFQANAILAQIDNIEGAQEEVDFIKAQCLTMRAHGYIRMMQVYAPRFEDSRDGTSLCLILRDKPGTDAMPLSTYKECIDFIYNDLNTAISLYEAVPNQKRTMGYEPDINVAKGLYSRIALLNHDWQLASDMAEQARAAYPIMSPEAYRQGFADPTSEWIWYNDQDPSYVGFISWGSAYSSNGYYATAYNFSGAGCISFRIYDEIYNRHNDDVRCELFFTPDKANKYVDLKLTRDDFWNPSVVNTEYGYMYGPNTNENMSVSISLFVKNFVKQNLKNNSAIYMNEIGELEFPFGVDTISDDAAGNALKRRGWFNSIKNSVNTCQPGAQIKFWSYPSEMYATSHPFLRSSELLLTQAEAQFALGNEGNARNLLIELNEQRIPSGYTCNLSGEALRDEIRLYRRMELWGEGDCWFSFKRWNMEVTRTAWKENDPESDTFLSAYEGTYPADWGSTNYPQGGGWRYRIPTSETNYNPLVAEQLNQ